MLLPIDCKRRCVVESQADTSTSAPFQDAVGVGSARYPATDCAHTPLCLARRHSFKLRMACTRHCALESSGGGQSYLRPLPHVIAKGVVRCCGALLSFSHCVHTPSGTWVARYGCVCSSRHRYDFTVWRGCTRAHGLPIASPAATRVVRRQFQRHIFDMTRVWMNSLRTYDWHDYKYSVRAAAALARDMGLS